MLRDSKLLKVKLKAVLLNQFYAWMYIMDAQVGLKTIALTLFLNLFFHFLPAAALCDDFSLVDSVET